VALNGELECRTGDLLSGGEADHERRAAFSTMRDAARQQQRAIDCGGHEVDARIERRCWPQALRHDGRAVSERRMARDGTHVFWVMEGLAESRSGVETPAAWRPRSVAVRRNGTSLG
jgi:hypothetical protein